MTESELLVKIKEYPDEMDTFYYQGCLHVRHHPTKACFKITELGDDPWEHLLMIFRGQRPSKCLTHMTRIVGYYSQVNNWNLGKLGELTDRRKGNYGVPQEGI